MAARHGIGVEALRQANPDIGRDQDLLAGDAIRLPPAADAQPQAVSSLPGVYKQTDASGRVQYGDVTGVQASQRADHKAEEKSPHAQAKDLIQAAQKHGGKLDEYVKELDYLRHHNPVKLDAVLKELKKSNPELWIELQKNPSFKALSHSFQPSTAGGRYLEAGVTAVTKGPSDAAVKFGEGTIKELIKRDDPAAKPVLGSRASTLPEPAAPAYSKSRLGEHLKADAPRAAAAAKAAGKELEAANDALRATKATALARVAGPVLDLAIAALDSDVYKGMLAIKGQQLATDLVNRGIISPEDALLLPGMLARGEFAQANEMIEAGLKSKAESGQ